MAFLPNILNGATTNTSGTKALSPTPSKAASGDLFISGTFDGATVTLYGSMDNTTFAAYASGVFTAPTIYRLETRMRYLKATITGAGGSTNISVHFE